MSRIRVLVVDDSAVIRRMLTDVLNADPELEVVGGAPNGELALARLDELKPDAITLDVEMPGMSGLDLLTEIRKRLRRTPVIMFSSLTQRAASTTLEALARGATDYVTKPSNTGSREASIEHVRSQLVPRIKALASTVRQPAVAAPVKRALPTSNRVTVARTDIVAIAASTGGPNALSDLFRGLQKPLGVPIVITQHMPPLFTRLLAERLHTPLVPVHEAVHGMLVEPGHVYIAPGDNHLVVARQGKDVRVVLDRSAPENSCRPAADVMFRSVAATFHGHCLAVVLTGMGQDGLLGVTQLRELGAHIIVQDEASSVVWGMPGAIATNGLADQILPLGEIPNAIIKRAGTTNERRLHVC